MGLCDPEKSWNVLGGKRRHKISYGQEKGKSSFEILPPQAPQVIGCGRSSGLEHVSSLHSLFSMQVRRGHSHCGREATVAAAWLLEP